MSVIQLIESGSQVGVKVDNTLAWYDRVNMTVSSDANGVISLFNNKYRKRNIL